MFAPAGGQENAASNQQRPGAAGCREKVVSFGLEAVDAALPGGGLALGTLHEVAGIGCQVEHGAAAALLAAGLVAQVPGEVLWVMEQADIHPPALAAVGLTPDRVVYVHARKPQTVLLVMEEGLGLAGVVAELSGALGLTASRRLQLAAEQSGVTAFLLRRSRCFDDPVLLEPSAAVNRWRVATVPSGPPLPHAPETPVLGRPRWRLDLIRCRGREAHSWIVEASDATGRCRLVADLADRPAAAEPRRATPSAATSSSRASPRPIRPSPVTSAAPKGLACRRNCQAHLSLCNNRCWRCNYCVAIWSRRVRLPARLGCQLRERIFRLRRQIPVSQNSLTRGYTADPAVAPISRNVALSSASSCSSSRSASGVAGAGVEHATVERPRSRTTRSKRASQWLSIPTRCARSGRLWPKAAAVRQEQCHRGPFTRRGPKRCVAASLAGE